MFVFFTECAEKLFDLVDGFAESTKRKAAVWPLQIILLILCPEIIQDISKDGGREQHKQGQEGNEWLPSPDGSSLFIQGVHFSYVHARSNSWLPLAEITHVIVMTERL